MLGQNQNWDELFPVFGEYGNEGIQTKIGRDQQDHP
jgi:hypothetical protein